MLIPWRRSSALCARPACRTKPQTRHSQRSRPRLEELESRLAPSHSVIFFESNVSDFAILKNGLAAGAEAVVLNSGADGLHAMAEFVTGRHDLSAIGVVAHGAAGTIDLGSVTLSAGNLPGYARELATIGSALA